MSSTLFLPSTESQTWKRVRKGTGLIAPIGGEGGEKGVGEGEGEDFTVHVLYLRKCNEY